jgi:hypothetical protein
MNPCTVACWSAIRSATTAYWRAAREFQQATARAQQHLARGADPAVIAAAIDEVEASQRELHAVLDRPVPGSAAGSGAQSS